jgi:DNA mismatch repair ATPase MutS
MFVMMDEIFHSTNAMDGQSASHVFLEQLYKLSGITSVVSTHYIQLASDFKEATALKLVTNDKEDTTLEYTYRVAPGVSNKSSVMEILRERGLLAPIVAVV